MPHDVTNSNPPTEPNDAKQNAAATEAPDKIIDPTQREALGSFTQAQLEALDAAGFKSYDELAAATDDELRAVPGVGDSAVERWRKHVASPEDAKKPDAKEQARIDEATERQRADQAQQRGNETAGVSPDGGEIAEPEDKRAQHRTCTVSGCHERAEVYQGENENKTGTAWCPKHGRVSLG